jgi:hypothetical protein
MSEGDQREGQSVAEGEAVEPFEPELPDLPQSEMEEPDDDDWLFDSERTYLEQLDHYPAKGKRKKFLTCQQCQQEFRPARQKQQYCSPKCRNLAFQERKAAEKEVKNAQRERQRVAKPGRVDNGEAQEKRSLHD